MYNHILDEVCVGQHWMVMQLRAFSAIELGIEGLFQEQRAAPYHKSGVLRNNIVVGPYAKRHPLQDPSRKLWSRIATCLTVR